MVSHNMMIKEATYGYLKTLKARLSRERGKTVSFTETINELIDYYEHDPTEDDREMSYEEASKVSDR